MTTTPDETKLQELLGKMAHELGAIANAPLVMAGDKLGLYKALAKDGPMTSQQLADATGTGERYIREWLAAQAASGYVQYDAHQGTFSMTPEQVMVLADDSSPFIMTGSFFTFASMFADEEKMTAAIKSGEGVSWGDHHSCLFCGTERFFRPLYDANLVQSWLPALEGITARLEAGAKVADVGCGHGISTLIMARAYPNSHFTGFDFHAPSVEHAAALAREEGLENVSFAAASAQDFPGEGYDLIAFMDALHDMGDPVGALAHAQSTLAEDGTVFIVEPNAADSLAENLNPVARIYYACSTMLCVPNALSQEGGVALGAQAGPKRLQGVAQEAGFSRFRVATATPFNMVLEVRA